MRRLPVFLCFMLLISTVEAVDPAPRTLSLAPVARWLDGQRAVRTLVANFVQTKALKALRDPLATPGRLWFRAPDSFRWELGNPARSILLRRGGTVWLISPNKQQAVRFPAKLPGAASGLSGLMLLNFPLAANLADFQRQFEVLEWQEAGGVGELKFLPREAQARQFLQALILRFATDGGELRSFELQTKDGSVLRQDFSNVRTNVPVDVALFDFDFTGYTVTDGPK